MSRKFLTAVDLAKNELQNAAVQSLAAAPSSPAKFQLYGNSGDNTLYWWDGAIWQSAKGGSMSFGSVPAETTFGIAKSDGVATTAARSDHTHGSPTHDAAAHSAIPLSALAVPTGPVSFNGQRVTNVGTPTSGTDAANKDYVDNGIAGLSWKDAARAASTGNVALTGTQTVDGVALAAGDRVLLKNQTAPAENGLWVVASGAWTRATDADTAAELDGMAVFVSEGTTQADTTWTLTTNAPITVGTTGLTYAQFSGASAATAGAGLSAAGNVFNVGAGTGITVAADTVALDTAYTDGRYALAGATIKRFAADVGGATAVTVTHNLGTTDVLVSLYRKASPFDEVEADVEHATTNTVIFRFTVAPAAAEYRAVVVA